MAESRARVSSDPATPEAVPPLAPLTETTRSAHWAFDEPRYFGHRVFSELGEQGSWTSLQALSVFGHKLPPELCAVLDDAAVALTLADPRIWPLKLTRLVGAYGAFVPALSAGVLMENGARVGPWACVEAAKALTILHTELAGNSNDSERVREVVNAYRKRNGFIWGFGTPYRARDERVVSFHASMQRRGRDQLPYYRTLIAVATAIKAETKAEPNIGGVLASVLLDMGLEPTQVGAMVVALVQHMFMAHALESANAPNPNLRELPVERVRYEGPPERTSPRAREALRDAEGDPTSA